MELVQPHNPATVRCPACGHSVVFLWDPVIPVTPDPDGDADGLLVVDSYNGQEIPAAMELRRFLTLTPLEALKLVRERPSQLLWPFRKGIWRLRELKERLDSIGVSSHIRRTKNRR